MDRFVLRFLWLEKSIAVALDQKVGEKSSPLTEYFFWPRRDAWEEMRIFLEDLSWISQNESVVLLNQITEIINLWQQKNVVSKKDMEQLKEKFAEYSLIKFSSF